MTTPVPINKPLSTVEGFACGGIAACIAVRWFIYNFGTLSRLHITLKVTVSNPAEVAKTRLQLQGELAKEGGKKVYKHALDVFSKTWKNEGIRGMQRGLYPAVRRITCLKLCLSSLIVCIPSKS